MSQELIEGQSVQVRRSGTWQEATVVEVQPRRVIVRVAGKRRGYDPTDVRTTRTLVSPRRFVEESAEPLAILPFSPRGSFDDLIERRPIVERPKARPVRSQPFLSFVRQHPCCCCGHPRDIEAHHIVNGGTGKKASDRLTAPLTAEHHAFWHQHGYLPGRDRIGSLACMWEASARIQDAWEQKSEERRKR